MTRLLPLRDAADLEPARADVLDAETMRRAGAIVDDVAARGFDAVREHAERLGDVAVGAPLVLDREDLLAALQALPDDDRQVLERTAARIRDFAVAQRSCLVPLETEVPGGRAGHVLAPVERAGCYAPGGRYPLPSSVLMTAVTARAAGVREVWVASPRPSPVTLAAAAVAGADGLLACGGAQAIAALAHGAGEVPACDVVVGPGNRYVTAAKKLVAGEVGIDMLAGPSELLVVADAAADPGVIAADLLGQAEHDPDARPVLVAVDAPGLLERVEAELAHQLAGLPTAEVARQALSRGAAVAVENLAAAVTVCDLLAPEHLQLLVADPGALTSRLKHFGGLFLGARSAEVFGDYGVGPNHVLPTGGAARHSGGLSVFTFLRVRTWLELDDVPGELLDDVARLAELEGLAAHRAAALRRAGG